MQKAKKKMSRRQRKVSRKQGIGNSSRRQKAEKCKQRAGNSQLERKTEKVGRKQETGIRKVEVAN